VAPVTPPLASVPKIIDIGFSEPLWAAFGWKAAWSRLNNWLMSLEEPVPEPLSELEAAGAAW
jgi:hypothetical protein